MITVSDKSLNNLIEQYDGVIVDIHLKIILYTIYFFAEFLWQKDAEKWKYVNTKTYNSIVTINRNCVKKMSFSKKQKFPILN